ncbi:MAG: OB-fold nucleic acid binding domain-containing protein, partial [Anaerolineae bacterium]
YRPGPMEHIPSYIARLHGEEPVTYRHPRLRDILAETFGIVVYQEQIIQVAQELAGYDAGEADTIRKAVGKKNKADLLAHREKFIQGATSNGIEILTAEGVWHDIETFARYGFNKAHAADYAVIVCQTAFFKAHYPVEYMAALLSVERNNTDKVGYIIADCRRLGIELLPPAVNSSGVDFAIEAVDRGDAPPGGEHDGRGIRYGLAAVKNVGQGAVEAILAGRGQEAFQDLDDFCRRVDLRPVGKRALECLVKVGALETFGSRAGLLDILDRVLAFSASHHEAADRGQLGLFEGAPAAEAAALLGPVPALATDQASALAWEKELIGHYISEHPLHRAAADVADQITATIADLNEAMTGQQVTVAGMVADVRRITTRKGAAMAFARLDDLQGAVDVTIFPSIYETTRPLWQDDRIVLVRGKVELRNDRLQLIVDDAWEYDPTAHNDASASAPRGEDASPSASGSAFEAPRSARQPQAPGAPGAPAADAAPAAGAGDPPARSGTQESPAPYRLTITLPRTGDVGADVALLKEVYDVLAAYDGQDHFALRVPNGAGLVELDFPNSRTRYCLA